MSGALDLSRQDFLDRYQDVRARLPGPAEPRAQAAAAFARLGLPHARMEAWRYTSLRPVADVSFHHPAEPHTPTALPTPAALARLPVFDSPRLVFVDGRARPDLSTATLPQNVTHAAGQDTPALSRPDRDAFAALNAMLTEDGADIVVPAGTDAGTIQLVNLADGTADRATTCHPRHRIVLGAGARLRVIEIALGEGTYLHAPVIEISVGAGASLTHLRLQDESPAAFHVATLYADVDAAGRYDSFLLAMGARLSRTEMHVRIGGQGASVQMNCAQLLRGIQHGDFTTVLAHDAPSGRSRQTVRTVLDGHARGVFQGRIDVARIAQQTDGYQMNHALLLSPHAEIDSKPELRINADDVKCSHGATVGALDPDQLFYLRSRGVSGADARAMLIRGFLAESFADIPEATAENADARALFEQAAEIWWHRAPPTTDDPRVSR